MAAKRIKRRMGKGLSCPSFGILSGFRACDGHATLCPSYDYGVVDADLDKVLV